MFTGKIIKLAAVSLLMALFSLSQFAQSEELPKASKRTNVEYFEIVYVKYNSGKADDAYRLVTKYFVPATIESGTAEPYVVHFQTGPWDSAYVWTQKNGMGDFNWSMSPDDEKWFATLAKQNGGVEKAKAIFDEYYSMVANARREIGHHHMAPTKAASK